MRYSKKLNDCNEDSLDRVKKKDDMADYFETGNNVSELDDISERSYEEGDTSSEEEILPLHSETDSENSDVAIDDEIQGITDSDIEEHENDFPSSNAWGRNVKQFYNTNRIDSKTKFDNEEEELARLEEIEARNIQQKLLSELEDVDLSLDLMTCTEKVRQPNKENEFKKKNIVELDLTGLSEIEKSELLKQSCPHLKTYIHDFKRLLGCANDELLPLRSKLKSKDVSALEFVEIFQELIMNYCTNIAFFFLLRSQTLDTALHPITKWILNFREMLRESEIIYHKVVKSQNITNQKSNCSEKSLKRKRDTKTSGDKSKNLKLVREDEIRNVVPTKIQDSNLPQLYDELSEIGNDEKEIKRAINYQIAKNKGLTPHRKKELRNPRVKHRMKYRKAKIRRRGQVREARKEIQKYGGEISGIKATVVKSVKFKT